MHVFIRSTNETCSEGTQVSDMRKPKSYINLLVGSLFLTLFYVKSAKAEVAGWVLEDLTVSQFIDNCRGDTKENTMGLVCISYYLSLDGYLEGTKQICPKGRREFDLPEIILEREMKRLKQVFRHVKEVSTATPSKLFQDVVTPMLRRWHPC